MSEQEYRILGAIGSAPTRFYETANRHRLKNQSTLDDLLTRPIISNNNTASYQLAKYLAKLLSSLSVSEYCKKYQQFHYSYKRKGYTEELRSHIL